MLLIYNTATRKKEEFIKKPGETVTMYNCGLTVYDYPHIGNLRAYTMADTIRRGLEFLGYDVKQVQNFTDVGHMTLTDEQKASLKEQRDVTDEETGIDRIEKAAKKLGKTPEEVAQFYIDAAMDDFHKMNFEEPFARPQATKFIEEQKDLIKRLLDKGFAYITESAIYYDTSKFPNYGSLTGQNLNDKKVGVRDEVEVDPNKKNPHDFRLWQLDQPNHAQQWDFFYTSPASAEASADTQNLRGFPGWHVECSAMIHSIFGEPIDIHTGGVDHISVHHTNEIAQTEAAYDHPLAHFWVHNEFLLVDGRKMSKSLGNFYTLKDIEEKGFSAMDLRYFYLTANFTTQQNFTWEALGAARSARKNIINSLRNIFAENSSEIEELKTNIFYKKFESALEDSFNMPEAISVVWDVLKSDSHDIDKILLILAFDKVFGLDLEKEMTYQEELGEKVLSHLQNIITKRQEAKAQKDFTTADKLRDEAKELGFELEDTKDGTIWKKIA